MGLGIVLLFWGIVGLIAAAGAAVTLAAAVYLVDRWKGRFRPGWLMTAALAPFVGFAYAAACLVVYGLHCEFVRDVDLGIGDSWQVPLGSTYALVMIDTPDQAFIRGAGGEQLHFGLKRIGTAGDFIGGEDDRGYFILNSHRRTDQSLSSESDMRAQLPPQSARDFKLVSPGQFYQQQRWGWPDVLAATAFVIPPLLALGVLGFRFARSRPTAGSLVPKTESSS